MRVVKNKINVTFAEATEKVRGLRRSDTMVRFRYTNDDNEEIRVNSIKSSALYSDWYDLCEVCPSNDTVIRGLHILIHAIHTSLVITDEVTFEQLMDTLENVMTGRNCRD